ncbi:heme oxygenase (decycling) 1 [Mortierella sp. AD094]|nr:heme oxygenase (decycling) 1 [Mortierella sp. AD094]
MVLLAADLKEGTKAIHTEAERSKFVKYFFKGEITSAAYGRFLVSLALEKSLDKHKENTNIELVYFPEELSRKQALEEDLKFYSGPEWRSMLTPISPAQQSYIDAIERCDATKPELLIAHCYVRYFGDLSGGQILSRKLQKHNNLPEGKGVAFYSFDKIEDKGKFKELYRKRLNQVEVDEAYYNQVIEESRQAFVMTIDIFQELDHLLDDPDVNKTEYEVLQCPFMAKKGQEGLQCPFMAKRDQGGLHYPITTRKEQEDVQLPHVNETSYRISSLLSSLSPSNLIRNLALTIGVRFST